ncbi:hypothetical protein GCM10010378_53880 [Streptomyces viridochromogenes]
MYGRALVMRCRAIAGCSQVVTWGDGCRVLRPLPSLSNLEIVADMGEPPVFRSAGWEAGGSECGASAYGAYGRQDDRMPS